MTSKRSHLPTSSSADALSKPLPFTYTRNLDVQAAIWERFLPISESQHLVDKGRLFIETIVAGYIWDLGSSKEIFVG
jgi:hypothetical protein